MRPILFHIGPWAVFAYGLALAIAFVVGGWLGVRRARTRGLEARDILLTAAWAFIAAVVGSRVAFLLVEQPAALARPAEWFRFADGGLVFYGGFLAAVASSALYARAKGIPFLRLADVLAPSIALGHAIVRVGCFLNGCCYGTPVSWGIVIPRLGDGIPRHPAQLYEAAAGITILAGLLLYERKVPGRAEGDLVLLYAATYGAARFVLELFRDDDRGIRFLGLTISQIIAILILTVSAACFARSHTRPGRPPTPDRGAPLSMG